MSPIVLPADRITAKAATPERWGILSHGILGNRRNWRSFARRLVERRPELGLLAVDLRNHGDSPPTEGPHTLSACAADLAATAAHHGIEPAVLLGHSFGGKVVLEAARSLPRGLEQVWVLDSRPDPMTAQEIEQSDVYAVISTLRSLPASYDDRQAIVPLLQERGFSTTLARWMTTNLARGNDSRWHWRFQLDAVVEMIHDYYQADLRHVLEAPVADLRIHIVRAERSDRWQPELLHWIDHLPGGAPGLLHTLEDAGHWLHVDNPDGLLDLIDLEL